MKSFIAISIAAFSIFAANPSKVNVNERTSSTTVYICTGPKAKVYHKYKDCKGLNRCSGDIVAISLEKAKKTRRACKICY